MEVKERVSLGHQGMAQEYSDTMETAVPVQGDLLEGPTKRKYVVSGSSLRSRRASRMKTDALTELPFVFSCFGMFSTKTQGTKRSLQERRQKCWKPHTFRNTA